MTVTLTSDTREAAPAASHPSRTLGRYKRHAESFGPHMVFETARDDPNVSVRQLAQLAGFLRDLPVWRVCDARGRLVQDGNWSRFRLAREQRDRLIRELVQAGEPNGFITSKLRVTNDTVRRIREGDNPETGQNPQQPRVARNSDGGTLGVLACPYCGGLFAQPTGRGRPRKYCCEEHRRKHQTELRRAGS